MTATPTQGAGELVRLVLRRNRMRIPVRLAAITGPTYASGAAVSSVYPDQRAVDGYARLVEGSPITVAFSGPPVGLHTQAGVCSTKCRSPHSSGCA
jgi:ABC-2 type transport system permease protein